MVRLFIRKVLKDNVTMLASVVAWGVLSSIIPILVALIAISGLALHDPVKQQVIVASLSRVLQNVLTTADLRALVHLVVDHTGLLGVLGAVGMLWGASNFGGAIATVFQPIFQVRGRPLLQQKLIDVGMIFVFTVRMVVIVAATTAGALLHRVLSTAPLTDASSFIVGTTVSLLAAYLLFFVIYAVFPNIEHRFRAGHIWKGAGIAALLFQVLSYIWPLYVVVFHPQRYGAVLVPIVVVDVWIYFFALILVLGAEVVAFGALADARAAGQSVGPAPDGTVPQRISMANEEPAANRPPANEIAAWRHALSPRSRARATTSSGRPTLAG